MHLTTPATVVNRFQRDIAALVGDKASATHRFGLAVSGGPDSLALLLLAETTLVGRIEVATVDHGLRPDSTVEARFVAALCASRSIPHSILNPDAPLNGNLHACARAMRYRLLADWAERRRLDWIVTAHHADDQTETMLMRLQRGTGLAGLASVRAKNGRILRPLLGWRRAKLRAIVDEAHIAPIDDPSNLDRRFTRTAIRTRIAALDWIDPLAWSDTARHCADAETALNWAAERLYAERKRAESDGLVLPIADLPHELQRRLLLKALHRMGAGVPRGTVLSGALAALARGCQTMIGDVLLRQTDGGVRLTAAPPRRT